MWNLSKADWKDNDTRIDALIAKAKALRELAAKKAGKVLAVALTRKQKSQERKEEARIAKKLKLEKSRYKPLELPDQAFIKDLKKKLEAKSGKNGT